MLSVVFSAVFRVFLLEARKLRGVRERAQRLNLCAQAHKGSGKWHTHYKKRQEGAAGCLFTQVPYAVSKGSRLSVVGKFTVPHLDSYVACKGSSLPLRRRTSGKAMYWKAQQYASELFGASWSHAYAHWSYVSPTYRYGALPGEFGLEIQKG